MSGRSLLARARQAVERHAWRTAFDLFSRADARSPLAAPDLERFGLAAFLLDRADDFVRAFDRAHRLRIEAGEYAQAARCAFWLALRATLAGHTAQANGWISQAHHLIKRVGDCVERGYILLPEIERRLMAGDASTALSASALAVEIGERFNDADLVACARHTQGRALVMMKEVERGLSLLDEAMVAVLSGAVSPVFTGLVYCSVIDACLQLQALSRAQEWTAALGEWCERQSELVAFTGTCRVHRSEVLLLQGDWANAMSEACRACERFENGQHPRPPAAAYYRQGELYRLQGRYREAEAAYSRASQWGLDPQPGLALLRLAQGEVSAAQTAVRRALTIASDPVDRARLLAANIEICCTEGNVERALADCAELEAVAAALGWEALVTTAAYCRGMTELARGQPEAAIASLRAAVENWRRVEAPYLAARARLLLSRSYAAIGDREGSELERDAARAVFQRLGAQPDLDAMENQRRLSTPPARLTARELQVLRLVAQGRTNKAIARELHISGKTVDRHLSNIFSKLEVSSRAAAVAHGYQHNLI